jgi:Fic family protein
MIDTSQKLRLILKISALSQEKLAMQLGVSFVSLNKWINKKSIPRTKHTIKIDELYRTYTGEKQISQTVLQGKKSIILKKMKHYESVIQYILQHSDIYDQFILSFTYNTNSIEGSTLTENETAVILFQNRTLANKTLIEQLEAKNHQAAFEYLFNKISEKSFFIDEKLILRLHEILMNGIAYNAGLYRRHGVRIVGSGIPTANYLKVPFLMDVLIKDIQSTQLDTIAHVTRIHSSFEKIHPFSDGNGRIGRLIIHAMLLMKNIVPAHIQQENKNLYYTSLQKSQKSEDYSLLEDFICDSIFEGLKILERSV